MDIVCLDLEGVLVPEIWIAFAEASGIPELKRTTRDEPDYDKLMKWRLGILKEHGLGLKEIQETIAKIDPLPGAKEFLEGDHDGRSLRVAVALEERDLIHEVGQCGGADQQQDTARQQQEKQIGRAHV